MVSSMGLRITQLAPFVEEALGDASYFDEGKRLVVEPVPPRA